MSKCKNQAFDHECHPYYSKKYDGFCLDCDNCGVPELLKKLDTARTALQIILTWATFEYGDLPKGHALEPYAVATLCEKTLEEIKGAS